MTVAITPLSLTNIVDITVTVAPQSAVANTFNQGLFIGNSGVIPSYGANARIRQYTASSFSTAMLTDGFTTSSPEYIAATIYFSQTPQPQFIWIGCQDPTALQTITINAAGTGWAVGDEFNVVASGGTYGIGKVLAETSGIPSSIEVLPGSQGTGYSVESATTTAISPSTGTGLTVHITAVGETLLQSATACRAANAAWYGLAVYNPVDADNLALAAWADANWQSTRYYAWSSDVAIPNGTANNLALQMQTLEYRVIGIYSTTQSGLYSNNIYAAAGLMGVDMGYNTGLAGSFFTLAHKQIAGIAAEPLTQTQFTNIETQDWNVYGNFTSSFQLFEPGTMSNGAQTYLWMYLAMYVANLQINIMNVLASSPAVPQTNAGEQLLIAAANAAGALMASIGFLATANWTGANIPIPSASNPGLVTGQSVLNGYLNLAPPYSQQSPSDRDAGQAQPIYSAITTAGAVQSIVVGVYTQL